MWCVISGSVAQGVCDKYISNGVKQFGGQKEHRACYRNVMDFGSKNVTVNGTPKCIESILLPKSLLHCALLGVGLWARSWSTGIRSHYRTKVQHYKVNTLNGLTPFLKSLIFIIHLLVGGWLPNLELQLPSLVSFL